MPNSAVFAATLISKEQRAIDAVEFVLELDSSVKWSHQPGQYIWLILPELKYTDPKGNRRAFSLTSRAGGRQLSFLCRVTSSGFKRTLNELPLQTKLQLIGPRGSSFVLLPTVSQGTQVVMIGGGVGISPFLGILRSLQVPVIPNSLSLIQYSSDNQACNLAEITALTTKHKVYFHHSTDHFSLSHLPDSLTLERAIFAISGSQIMIDSTARLLMDHGINREQLRFEQLYPSFEVKPLFGAQ